MKNPLVFVLLFSTLFFSCASSAHVVIPGEGEVIKNNIASEYMTIADSYNELGKYDKAISYYQLAMKNKNLYWSCYYKLGRCYAMNKNWTEARKVYNRLYKRDKENLNLKLSHAYIYAMEGKFKTSQDIYGLLIKENPSNVEILVNYIDVLIADKKYDEAYYNVLKLKENFSDNTSIAEFEKKIKQENPSSIPVEVAEEDKNNVIEEEN